MNTVKILLIGCYLLGSLAARAISPVTRTTLPTEVSQLITHQLTYNSFNPGQNLNGVVWMQFYIDEDGQFRITSLSSNNLNLGEYAKNRLIDLPPAPLSFSNGAAYYVKIRVTQNFF